MEKILPVLIQSLDIPSFQEFITVMVRLTCTVIVSMVIGLERQRYFKGISNISAAGFRTYTLVGLGSCLFALASIYGFESHIPSVAGVVVDPGRVAAQVVTGVGFLGAGVIYLSEGKVKGLTTAAGLWVSAALGLMFGAGLIIYGIIAALFAYLFLDFHRLFPKLFNDANKTDNEKDSFN